MTRSLLAAAALTMCSGLALAGGDNGPTTQEKELELLMAKDPNSSEARRAMANWWYGQTRAPASTQPRVIYGDDDRKEVYEYDLLDPQLRQMAEAAAVVVNLSDISDNGDGTYTLLHNPWTSAGGTLCADEPFRGQPQMGFCSAFLVGPDLMVTAGHCISSPGNAFVFGFQLNDSDETGPVVVPADWIYFADSIVTTTLAGDDDYTVARLDRDVVGINPVPIRHTGVVADGTPLAVIGHPAVILKKISGGAEVKSNAPAEYFTSNLDTYGGNSGSMVINLDTYTVEGILVRGAPDYTTVGGCVVSNRVPDSGNTGGGLVFEEVSKTTRFESFVPELGLAVNPAGLTQHIGLVGGPFTNDTPIDYVMSNPTGDPIDYAVVMTGDGFMDLSGDPLSGTIAGGGTATVTATLNASAGGFADGVYTVGLTFTDVTNGRDTLASHELEVGQTLVTVDGAVMSGGGPVGGPFPLSGDFTITSQRPTAATVEVSADVAWIDVDGVAADTNPSYTLTGVGDSAVIHATINSAADSLPAGLVIGNLTFTNTDNGDSDSFQVLLDVGRFVFTSADTPIAISDNATITSTITVPSGICVGDVDIDLDLNHTFSGDLHITLTSPEGTSVKLHDETGGSDDFTPRFYDDDDAANTLPDGPGALADYEQELAAGDWVLTVFDDAGGDTGSLNSWQLRIATLGDVCPPRALDGALAVDENWLATATLDAVGGTPPYQFTITTLPTQGVLWDGIMGPVLSVPFPLSGDTVLFRADIGAIGADSFGFTANDGGNDSAEATVTVTIGASGPIHFFGFDTDPGWSTEGQWAFGVPTGGGSHNFDPTAGFTGNNVYGYDLGGDYVDNMPEYALTTSALAIGGAGDLELSFQRWLGVESASFDHAKIEVAGDGGAWQTVWEHTGTTAISDNIWVAQSFDLDAFVGGATDIQIRWIMGATDTSVTYPGWNIDDVAVSGTIVGTRGAADFTGDGIVDSGDLGAFIDAFLNGQPAADMTGDGIIDSGDLGVFITAFLAG